MKLIKNAQLVLREEVIEGSLLFGERIEKINEGNYHNITDDNLEIIDAEGSYLTPGFIDIHTHGAIGHDVMDASHEAIDNISRAILTSGVTSFLPTTMTMPGDNIRKALDNIREVMSSKIVGACPLGVHLEGPFINPDYKGAQNEKDILFPEMELIKEYLDILKIITIAPERKGARELIQHLTKEGIIVSAGHTGASYEDMLEARGWGLSHTTHLFNGMNGFHHRKPGVVGAVLTSDISCELITDFIHLHPAVIKMVLKVKDRSQVILITDQMRASYLKEGEYELGGQRVIVKDGSARLENGQLAGSLLTLDQAVRNIHSLKVLSLPELINLVTYNPAKLLGIDGEFGQIAPGYKADLVLLAHDLQVKGVFKDGEKCC